MHIDGKGPYNSTSGRIPPCGPQSHPIVHLPLKDEATLLEPIADLVSPQDISITMRAQALAAGILTERISELATALVA